MQKRIRRKTEILEEMSGLEKVTVIFPQGEDSEFQSKGRLRFGSYDIRTKEFEEYSGERMNIQESRNTGWYLIPSNGEEPIRILSKYVLLSNNSSDVIVMSQREDVQLNNSALRPEGGVTSLVKGLYQRAYEPPVEEAA